MLLSFIRDTFFLMFLVSLLFSAGILGVASVVA